MTIDINGFNSTEDGFDPTQIVQVGYSPQWQTHPNYVAPTCAGSAKIFTATEKGSYTVNYARWLEGRL